MVEREPSSARFNDMYVSHSTFSRRGTGLCFRLVPIWPLQKKQYTVEGAVQITLYLADISMAEVDVVLRHVDNT